MMEMEKTARYRKKLSEVKGTLVRTIRLSFLLSMAYLFFGSIQSGGLSPSFAGRVMDCLQLAGYPARCAGAVFSAITECLVRCADSMFYWIR